MKVTITDIHKRLKYLPKTEPSIDKVISSTRRAQSLIESENPNQIFYFIEKCCKETVPVIRFETMLDLLDTLAECGTLSQYITASHRVCSEYTSKVRDAKETQTYLRRKTGNIVGAVTNKIYKNFDNTKKELKQLGGAAKSNFKNNTNKIKNNIDRGKPKLPNFAKKKEEEKEKAIKESYAAIDRALTNIIHCDRIVENYNRISKRFNLDKVITENTPVNGVEDTVIRICELVETYNMPENVKFNTVLESCWYGMTKNAISFNHESMVTMATDYYLTKGNNYEMCATMLENSLVAKRQDYLGSELELITEEDPEEDQISSHPPTIGEEIREFATGYIGFPMVLKENQDFQEIFNKFKASDDEHKENKLQLLVRKLYSKSVNNAIDGTPSLLQYFRYVFIVGGLAINPIIGAVALIAEIFLNLHYSREEYEKMLKCFKNEITATEKKIQSTKDKEKKEDLEKYLESLKDAYKKIDDAYSDLLSDEELDKKYDEDDFDFGDDDFEDVDFDDDSFDSMGESVKSICRLSKYISLRENMITNFGKEPLYHIITRAPMMATQLMEVAKYFPSIINPEILSETLNDINSAISSKQLKMRYVDRCNIKICIEECKTLHGYREEIPSTDIFKETKNMKIGNEIINTLNELASFCVIYNDIIEETSIGNSIKLASEKLKKTMQNLSDKEKAISKTIDVSANNFQKAAEKSLTTDNRESVIRGSVLPSASKIVKTAIAGGALWLVNPAIAVIGVLGYLGASAKYKAKERQMVLDELEVELKICEKYIAIAEDKNDMKALKKLLQIQKELTRQYQRVKYKMSIEHGQKYHDAEETLNDMRYK